MPDYSLGKIYKITSPVTDSIYIGSTCVRNLSHRLREHVSQQREWQNGNQRKYLASFAILELGNYNIELIEKYPCTDKDELRAREQYHIRENKEICCNLRAAFLTPEETLARKKAGVEAWRLAHPEKIKIQNTEYYQKNAEALKAYQKEYAKNNPDKIKHAKNRCTCGGYYNKVTRKKHERTRKHQTYLNTRNDLVHKLNEKFGYEDWTNATLEEMHEILLEQ
jgi:hypothetical protein